MKENSWFAQFAMFVMTESHAKPSSGTRQSLLENRDQTVLAQPHNVEHDARHRPSSLVVGPNGCLLLFPVDGGIRIKEIAESIRKGSSHPILPDTIGSLSYYIG